MLLLDNSEWSRNGDYFPSRLFAQNDCAQAICNQRRTSNLENTLAIIAMAGGCPRVMISLANDASKLQHAINSVQVEGEQVELLSALNIAQVRYDSMLIGLVDIETPSESQSTPKDHGVCGQSPRERP